MRGGTIKSAKSYMAEAVNIDFISKASIIEQASMSGGTFLFFLFAARAAGSEAFGLFTLLYVPIQVLHSIAAQWVLLPITTSKFTEVLIISVSKRFLAISFLSPVMAYAFSILTSVDFNLSFAGGVALGGTLLIAFDALRYLTIRLERNSHQIFVNFTRWFVSLGCVIVLSYGTHFTYWDILLCFALGQLIGCCFSVLFLAKNSLEYDTDIKESEAKEQNGIAFFLFGSANGLFTIAMTSALASISVGALGAIQSFRSLFNIVPLVLQFVETHYVSSVMRTRGSKLLSRPIYVVFAFLILIIFFIVGGSEAAIVRSIYGESFVPYSGLLAPVMALILLQSVLRILLLEIRVSNMRNAIFALLVPLLIGVAVLFSFSKLPANAAAVSIIIFVNLIVILQALVAFGFLYRRSGG